MNSDSIAIPLVHDLILHLRVKGEGYIHVYNKIGWLKNIRVSGNNNNAEFALLEEQSGSETIKIQNANGIIFSLHLKINYSFLNWFRARIMRKSANFSYWFEWKENSTQEIPYPHSNDFEFIFGRPDTFNKK